MDIDFEMNCFSFHQTLTNSPKFDLFIAIYDYSPLLQIVSQFDIRDTYVTQLSYLTLSLYNQDHTWRHHSL